MRKMSLVFDIRSDILESYFHNFLIYKILQYTYANCMHFIFDMDSKDRDQRTEGSIMFAI